MTDLGFCAVPLEPEGEVRVGGRSVCGLIVWYCRVKGLAMEREGERGLVQGILLPERCGSVLASYRHSVGGIHGC